LEKGTLMREPLNSQSDERANHIGERKNPGRQRVCWRLWHANISESAGYGPREVGKNEGGHTFGPRKGFFVVPPDGQNQKNAVKAPDPPEGLPDSGARRGGYLGRENSGRGLGGDLTTGIHFEKKKLIGKRGLWDTHIRWGDEWSFLASKNLNG